MPNSYFKFKQFTIWQDQCAMKAGTDGVLLGACCNVISEGNVLDIGTGTGLIALMLAQRFPSTSIDAIEIDANTAKQANENILKSPWQDRISIYHQSLQEYRITSSKTYHSIVVNPPYFSNSMQAPKENRTTARHTVSLSLDELLDGVKKFLYTEGLFSIILPSDQEDILKTKCQSIELYCTKQINIKPIPTKPIARKIFQFEYNEKPCKLEELTIETGTRHDYTKEYIELTRDFYLYM